MSNVMRELEEFVKTIGTARNSKDTKNHMERVPPSQPQEKQEAETISTCQWSIRGDQIYAPMTATTASLPAGVYRMVTDMHGNIMFARGRIITDHLLRLPDTAGERLLASIQHFWESKPKFEAKGYLYKRGVLLYGPAGAGKTVVIMFLVEDLIARGGIIVLCEEPHITATALAMLREIEPERPLICIIEDLDEKIEAYGERQFLALLDGENQVGNCVNLASTNFPERLNPRIINRPSRFDEVIKIGMPSDAARRCYLQSRLTAVETDLYDLDKWVRDTNEFSIAHLRELVVAVCCLDRPYDETIERLKLMMTYRVSSRDDTASRTTGGYA